MTFIQNGKVQECAAAKPCWAHCKIDCTLSYCILLWKAYHSHCWYVVDGSDGNLGFRSFMHSMCFYLAVRFSLVIVFWCCVWFRVMFICSFNTSTMPGISFFDLLPRILLHWLRVCRKHKALLRSALVVELSEGLEQTLSADTPIHHSEARSSLK